MDNLPQRMIDPKKEPTPASVAKWIGSKNHKRWKNIVQFIDANYPDVFEQKWCYGGKKFGWALRYKKSKSFCNLIPEKNCFKLLLVFGEEERKKVETFKSGLTSHVRKDYNKAKTYFDGKWVLIVVDSKEVIADVQRLMKIKRKPKVKGVLKS